MTRPLTVINDCHVGAIRSGGTTPVTAFALRQWVLQQFASLLQQASGSDLLINGDLFDTENIPYGDLLEVLTLLTNWMIENPDSKLYLPPGNHDLSKTLTTMSSQQFLTKVLGSLLGDRVIYSLTGFDIEVAGHRGWVIPHVPNQELFNLELERVPAVKYLFVHCNFDNKFALQADHSLNMSKEQAEACPAETIVFGHEHQKKMALVGKVQITGNQFPTSVADCIGNSKKVMMVIDKDGFHWQETWNIEGSFVRADWRTLLQEPLDGQFIRVEGDASASEAPAVVQAISKLRKVHNAFVITNAVTIEGRQQDTSMQMEQVQNFNVMDALMKLLGEKNPAWAAKVKEIVETNKVA
jgi:DNA repair exonuclease SbcCD nuclease subunit